MFYLHCQSDLETSRRLAVGQLPTFQNQVLPHPAFNDSVPTPAPMQLVSSVFSLCACSRASYTPPTPPDLPNSSPSQRQPFCPLPPRVNLLRAVNCVVWFLWHSLALIAKILFCYKTLSLARRESASVFSAFRRWRPTLNTARTILWTRSPGRVRTRKERLQSTNMPCSLLPTTSSHAFKLVFFLWDPKLHLKF